ncbi:MAG: type II secretion system protein [Elusimicrobiota bacterium]
MLKLIRKLIKKSRGVTLVELLLAVTIMSISVVAVVYSLSRFSRATVFCKNIKSAENLCRDLIGEIRVKKFDEYDRKFSYPLGPESGEALPRVKFDDVDDYNGLIDSPVADVAGNNIEGFAHFKRTVEVCYVDGNFVKVTCGVTTPFKLIKVSVKWWQSIGTREEKVVSLSFVKAKDVTVGVVEWNYVLFTSNDNLSTTNSAITGNIHSNKNVTLTGCNVPDNITAVGTISPISIPGGGGRQAGAQAVALPAITYPEVLLPQEPNLTMQEPVLPQAPNLNLCELKVPELASPPFEINLQYYKNLAIANNTYYAGNINYTTPGCSVLAGGTINNVIYATGNITIGKGGGGDPQTNIIITANGAIIAEGNITRWNNSCTVTAPYPRQLNVATGKYHTGLLAKNDIILNHNTTLKGTFFALRDINFSPNSGYNISLQGDVRALRDIRTDLGNGGSINFSDSILHAGNACFLYRIGRLYNMDVRSSGKLGTQNAGIFFNGGGEVNGSFHAKENIVFSSAYKSMFTIAGTVRTDNSILTYNEWNGYGVTVNASLNAAKACVIDSLSGTCQGDIKTGGNILYANKTVSVLIAGRLSDKTTIVTSIINAQHNVYFASGFKCTVAINGNIFTKESILTYNELNGYGLCFSGPVTNNYYAGVMFNVGNLKNSFIGTLKAVGGISMSGTLVGAQGALFSEGDCTIGGGAGITGCVIARKINITGTPNTIYNKDYALKLFE